MACKKFSNLFNYLKLISIIYFSNNLILAWEHNGKWRLLITPWAPFSGNFFLARRERGLHVLRLAKKTV